MRVDLISCTSNPVDTILMASKVKDHKYAMGVLSEPLTYSQEQKEEYIKTLIRSNDDSPLEQITFTFLVEGISLMAVDQLIKYPIVSYSQYNYKKNENEIAFRIPDLMCDKMSKDNKFKEIVCEFLGRMSDFYYVLNESNIPLEYIQNFLPRNITSAIVFTMNGKAVRDFIKCNLNNTKQDELRRLSYSMLDKINSICPVLIDDIREDFFSVGGNFKEQLFEGELEKWMSVIYVKQTVSDKEYVCAKCNKPIEGHVYWVNHLPYCEHCGIFLPIEQTIKTLIKEYRIWS